MKHTEYMPSAAMHTPPLNPGHGRGIRSRAKHPRKPQCIEPSCRLNGSGKGGSEHFYVPPADHMTPTRVARPVQDRGPKHSAPAKTHAA